MKSIERHGRGICAALAAGALVLVALALAAAEWWGASACYLCVFQRVLFLALILPLVLAAAGWRCRLVAGVALTLALLLALGVIATAGYQSWLQWFPSVELSCGSGSQNPVERLVEWLTQWSQTLFMATGFCEDDRLKLFGLSLANWSLLAGIAYAALSALLLRAVVMVRKPACV